MDSLNVVIFFFVVLQAIIVIVFKKCKMFEGIFLILNFKYNSWFFHYKGISEIKKKSGAFPEFKYY